MIPLSGPCLICFVQRVFVTYASITFQLCFIRIRSCGRAKSKTKSKHAHYLNRLEPQKTRFFLLARISAYRITTPLFSLSFFPFRIFLEGEAFLCISWAIYLFFFLFFFFLAVLHVQYFVVSAFCLCRCYFRLVCVFLFASCYYPGLDWPLRWTVHYAPVDWIFCQIQLID